ncbi:hypothetical protein SDC9_152042 [bioreactor metagenome]|uniref:Uncharacterized protein n=1 Tax=bioreactor metagenome TaxID=1076179 RepID=A0A645EWF2_9ZZZZ
MADALSGGSGAGRDAAAPDKLADPAHGDQPQGGRAGGDAGGPSGYWSRFGVSAADPGRRGRQACRFSAGVVSKHGSARGVRHDRAHGNHHPPAAPGMGA